MKFFLENFKQLTTTPENIEQLKKLILQLAIQGKLTSKWREENPDIETASTLLRKIDFEKKQAIISKKLKQQKPLPKIDCSETPFSIPKTWEWVRLVDYGITSTGTTPSKNCPEFFGSNYPFVKPAEISLSGINYNTEDGLSELGIIQGRLIPKNSVLMVCIGGSIGKSYHTNRDVSCNQQINTITPLASISSKLVNFFLQSVYFQRVVWDKATGATTPIINKGKWERIPIPIPPLEEQTAIVAIVEDLFDQIDVLHIQSQRSLDYREKSTKALLNKISSTNDKDKLKQYWQILNENFKILIQSKESVKELRQAILQLGIQGKLTSKWRKRNPNIETANALLKRVRLEKEKLTREGKLGKAKKLPSIEIDEVTHTIPETWGWTRIGEIAQHNAGKTLDSGRNKGSLRKYITTSNLYWNRFDLDSLREMPFEDQELEKCEAKRGDLLVCEGGDAGRAAVWEKSNGICFQNHIHRVRPFGSINPYFLLRFLEKLSFSGEINKFRKGMGITNLSGQALSRIPLPIPPIEEQKVIVAKLEELFIWCDNLEKMIEKRDFLHKRMLKTAIKQTEN